MRIPDLPPTEVVPARCDTTLWAPATDDVCPAVVLRAAAAYLDTIGWTQGTYYHYDRNTVLPAACVTGAIAICCYACAHPMPSITDDPGRVAFEAAMDTLTVHLRHTTTAPGGLLVEPYWFNDQPARTKDQVVQVLIAAADRHDHAEHSEDEPVDELADGGAP
jgi:hypothetical protein